MSEYNERRDVARPTFRYVVDTMPLNSSKRYRAYIVGVASLLFLAYQGQFALLASRDDSIPDEAWQPSSERRQTTIEEHGPYYSFQPTLREERKPDEVFSACLLIKDDNHWLIEWLAYHYHVLPLRHLVIVSDPLSRTSPVPILERWKGMIEIEEWHDPEFLPAWVTKTPAREGRPPEWLHQNRQKFFYAKCLKHMKSRGRGWTLLTDTDEFVRVNPRLYPLEPTVAGAPGNVADFLEHQDYTKSCISIVRFQISSQERSTATQPTIAGINTTMLLTYRWLFHREKEMYSGKNAVHAQRVDTIPRRVHSVHHVMPEICDQNDGNRIADSPLVAQHYLGTLEQFTYRDDPRYKEKRASEYMKRGRGAPTRIEEAPAWLDQFVESVGSSEARRLLFDVGVVHSMPQDGAVTSIEAHPMESRETPPLGACLLVKDDNHWLTEWLAYHYHVGPLRKLIAVKDPTSRTSPDYLWRRWQAKIDLEEWDDDDFIPGWVLRKHRNGEYSDANLHRYRQQFFFASCLRSFRESQSVPWVLLLDTDEFVRPNYYLNGTDSDLSEAGCLSRHLERKRTERLLANSRSPTCLHVPRIQMASNESESDAVSQHAPDGFDGHDFLTLRWRYHGDREIVYGHSLDGKNVVDIRSLKAASIPTRAPNVHVVIPDICPATAGERLHHADSWLVIHHFLGSIEQYTFRDDPRDQIVGRPKRSEELWSTSGQPSHQQDDGLDGWLAGFVQSVGRDQAIELLDGVGDVKYSTVAR